PRARHLALVHVASGELADLEERRAGVEQALDAVARKQLAARNVALAVLFGPALRRLGDIRAQFLGKRAIVRDARAILVALGDDLALDPRRAHALWPSRCVRT